jgi:hypothetical protein
MPFHRKWRITEKLRIREWGEYDEFGTPSSHSEFSKHSMVNFIILVRLEMVN